MGQAVSCCYTASARDNDDSEYNMYCRGEQPWKEKIKTNEFKIASAVDWVDPKFTEEEIAQERMKIISSIFEERRARPCVYRRAQPLICLN